MLPEIRRPAGICVLVALLCPAPCLAAEDTVRSPRIRPLESRIDRVLTDAVQRSPTLRGLVAAVEASDVIVHVSQYVPCATRRQGGDLRLAGTSAGYRFLQIGVSRHLNDLQLAAMIAHELQHALEVALHPEVGDDAAMRALYARIGTCSPGHRFETAEAIRVEQQVLRELRAR